MAGPGAGGARLAEGTETQSGGRAGAWATPGPRALGSGRVGPFLLAVPGWKGSRSTDHVAYAAKHRGALAAPRSPRLSGPVTSRLAPSHLLCPARPIILACGLRPPGANGRSKIKGLRHEHVRR
jgi:hypothetical protein